MKTNTLLLLGTVVLATTIFAAAPAIADDGGISFGGSPHLMKGHASVAMQREAVNVDIHKDLIKVDCTFVFHNSGPACTVRMGFPDEGQGAEEPYQGEPLPTKNLKATFLTYESFVDGKKVPTQLVPTDDRTLFWHTKTVTFKAKSDCVIRDVYTLKPGAQVTNENGMYQQTSYVLHTGASWHGPIGHAVITFKFGKDVEPRPIIPRPMKEVAPTDFMHLAWSKLPPATVIYEGFGTPKTQANSLQFSKDNFKPTNKDDIKVYYAFRLLQEQN